MKTRTPLLAVVAILVSASIAVPPEVTAQAAQRAGQVSRAIPQVAIARGSQQMNAALKTIVDWGDVVHTGDGGRARIALDDGSLINVGSSSIFAVTQHNPAAQQTQIELTYGRMRSVVVKQTKPNAKFEVHTPVGVAGVVGTDFFLSYLNGLFQVIVYEGHIRFCNLDGVCVDVLAGQMATIRDGHQPPDAPSQATPVELTEAANATSVGVVSAQAPPPPHIGGWTFVGLAALVALPAIIIPVVTHHSGTTTPTTRGQLLGATNCQFAAGC
jgi:hypothetical protein